jgi:Tol biopolymer transport system component
VKNLRLIAAVSLLLAGALALYAAQTRTADAPRLAWIATAHQFGPVAYRDPVAAISPDGRWVAYSEGRFLRVQAVEGGPPIEFLPGDAQIRHLAWHPDNRTIVANGDLRAGWVAYDRVERTRRPLWRREEITARTHDGGTATARPPQVRQVAWSPDGQSLAGIVDSTDGPQVWAIAADGASARVEARAPAISFPAWSPRGEIACIATAGGRSRVAIPCGAAPVRSDPDLDVYGPIAVATDGGTVYAGMPSAAGTVDLWAIPIRGGAARRLTAFSRDTYAPSVATDGSVLFKVQSYRTTVARVAADGGATYPLAAFQSETPSWDPTGRWIGVTFGTWRRVVDDAHYPDIAQDVGIVPANADRARAPARVIHDSSSEDQSLCWSPNGQWIAFHSHKDQSDDIWLRPADRDAPATRITFLGRGAETGWPRWSPDGQSLLFTATDPQTHREPIYVMGVDQTSGRVTRPAEAVTLQGFEGDVMHVEWLPDSQGIVGIGKERPGQHAIFTADAKGGRLRVVHRFASEHEPPGIAASPDGREVAFIAPAPDGFFQVFRLALARGEPHQVTTDRSHKTQPAWSPDGRQIAFTVWNYDAQLWTLRR